MSDDPVLDEIHSFRQAFAELHQFDMEAMMQSIKQFSQTIITDSEGRFVGLRTHDSTVSNPVSFVANSAS